MDRVPPPPVSRAPSRLFFAVVASGIALGAVACTVTATVTNDDAMKTTGTNPERLLATPTLVASATSDAGPPSDASAATLDAGIPDGAVEAGEHGEGWVNVILDGGEDGGWAPTK